MPEGFDAKMGGNFSMNQMSFVGGSGGDANAGYNISSNMNLQDK